MYNSDQIANRIKEQCKTKGVTVKKLLEDIGLGFNTMSNMKSSMPKADSLAKIADYLNCSVDYLLGRSEMPALAEITDAEKQMLALFRELNEEGQEAAVAMLQGLASQSIYKKHFENEVAKKQA